MLINAPLVVFLNTNGIALLVFFVLIYEIFIVRDYEVAIHIAFSVITTMIFTVILKELFLVPRPFVVDGRPALAGLTSYSSMPSMHAAVAFSLATSVTLHQSRFGAFLFAVAALISIGRVVANVHYPTDIVIGLLVGVLVGVIFNQAHFYKWAKSLKKKRRIMSH